MATEKIVFRIVQLRLMVCSSTEGCTRTFLKADDKLSQFDANDGAQHGVLCSP
jgi:hypothetical protein